MRLADVRVTGLSALLLYVHPSVPSLLSLLCLLTYYVCLPIDCALTDRETRHTCFLSIRKFLLFNKEWNPIVEEKDAPDWITRQPSVLESRRWNFIFNGKVRYNCYKKAWQKFEEKQHECKWYVGRKCPHLRASNWRQKGSMEPRDSIRENIPGAFRLPPFLIRAARRWVEQQLLRIFQRKCWELLQVDFSFLNFDILKTICHMAKLPFL